MKELDEKSMRRVAYEISSGGSRSGLLDDLDERRRQNAIERIVDLANEIDGDSEETVVIKRPSKFPKWGVFVPLAAAAAIAAVFLVGVGLRRNEKVDTSDTIEQQTVSNILGTIENLGGAVILDGSELSARAQLISGALIRTADGRASASVAFGTDILVQKNSIAFVEKIAQGARVSLKRGAVWLSVDPGKTGREISVRTESGEIVVKGTVFRVATEKDGVEVRVLRGEVELIPRAGAITRLKAGRISRLGSEESADLTVSQMRKDRDLLVSLTLIEPDDVPVPRESGPDQVEAARAEELYRAVSEHAQNSPKMKLGEILSHIREKRASREWAQVSRLYETLIMEHGESQAAKAALVSLGQVRLEKLNDPVSAVRSFDDYLETGAGALKPEALQGKADALHALGDFCAEARILKDYVSKFPNAVFAKQARQRLNRLDGADMEGNICPDSRAADTLSMGGRNYETRKNEGNSHVEE